MSHLVNLSTFCLSLNGTCDADQYFPAGVSPGNESEYVLDGVRYFSLDMDDVPEGYCEVDVLVVDNEEELKCRMLSGHVAINVSRGQEGSSFDTLSPSPQWFLYVKGSSQVEDTLGPVHWV